MSRPLLSVRHVYTSSQLPAKLERGRVYFISDEQCFVIDMGDGRGAVRYGDKPGPQGIAGEPIPSLQGQIDELAQASLTTTANLHMLNQKTRADITHLRDALAKGMQSLKEQGEYNATALLHMLLISKNIIGTLEETHAAMNILSRTITNFYPASWGGHAGDGTNNITTGEIILADGTAFRVDESYYDGDSNVVTLTIYDTAIAGTLKEGDTVQIDNGYFTVNSISSSGSSGIITITLYQS